MIRRLIFIWLLALLSSGKLYSNTLFVSPNGSNQNAGSIHLPVKTIQKGIDKMDKGDTLIILPGYYYEKVLIENKTASKEQPTVIKAIGEVIIDGPDGLELKGTTLKIGGSGLPLSNVDHLYYPYYRGAVVRIQNCENIILEGLRIVNSEWMGISSLNCKNITIRYCFISDTKASGIYMLNSSIVTIAFNEITKACGYHARLGGHGSQEFLSIVNCTDFEVMYNRVHTPNVWDIYESRNSGVGGEGIDCKESSNTGKVHHNIVYNLNRPGLYVDAWDSQTNGNIEVFNNVVHDTQCGFALGCENNGKVRDIKVYNNLFYNNWLDGIVLADWALGGLKENVNIYNNTVFYNVAGISLGSDKHSDILVTNNISYLNDKFGKQNFQPQKAIKYVEKSNLFNTNPGFIEHRYGNYNLDSSSIAIDHGTNEPWLPAYDLNDAPRVVGKAVDCGAFEYGSVPASPRIIFVSMGGNDLNNGTFFAPYRTIQKAIGNLKAGDQLCILEGWYNEKLLIQDLKGTSENKIIIKALGNVVIDNPDSFSNEMDTLKNDPVMDRGTYEKHPKNLQTNASLIRIENCMNLIISGLIVQNAEAYGISIWNSADCQIADCSIKNSKNTAIYNSQSNNILLINNLIFQKAAKPNEKKRNIVSVSCRHIIEKNNLSQNCSFF